MSSFIRLFLCALLCAASVFFTGCQAFTPKADPSRFFALRYSGGAAQSTDAASSAQMSVAPSIGVLPVEMPAYLQRPQIVERASPSELRLHEFYRWSEPLQEGVLRVLGRALAAQQSSVKRSILVYPQAVQADWGLRLSVYAFEPAEDGQIVLEASWVLDPLNLSSKDAAQATVQRGEARLTLAWDGSYETLPARMSELVQQLAVEIAESFPL